MNLIDPIFKKNLHMRLEDFNLSKMFFSSIFSLSVCKWIQRKIEYKCFIAAIYLKGDETRNFGTSDKIGLSERMTIII